MKSFTDFITEDDVVRAHRILKTLHQITVTRGATPAEEANAKARIHEIHQKYGIHSTAQTHQQDTRPPPRKPSSNYNASSYEAAVKRARAEARRKAEEERRRREEAERKKQEDELRGRQQKAQAKSDSFVWSAFKAREKEEIDRKKAEREARKKRV